MKTERERYDELINNIIQEYLNTPELQRSLTKLQKKYGVKRHVIAKHLKLNNIEIINYQNLCRCDQTVFDTIDTEEKAYWLGFLYADGNISTTGHRLEVNLSTKDLQHLEKFRHFLKLTTKIKICKQNSSDKKLCRLAIRNKNIWNQLNDKGCVPCKSLILTFPNDNIFNNKNLIYDFIRGYCDGDGYLGFYKIYNTHNCCLSFIGTENFLISLKNFLGVSGYIRNKSYGNVKNKAFELRYGGTNARIVARLLYENSNIYLERKFNIYKNFCRFEEESSKTKSSKISRSWDANTEVNSEIAKGSESPQRIVNE